MKISDFKGTRKEVKDKLAQLGYSSVGEGCYRATFKVGKWAVKIPLGASKAHHSRREIRILQTIRDPALPRCYYSNPKTGIIVLEWLEKLSNESADELREEIGNHESEGTSVKRIRAKMRKAGIKARSPFNSDIWWGQAGMDKMGRVKLFDLGQL